MFRHSGDAELAAEHLLEEFALTEAELNVFDPGEAWRLERPAAEEYRWVAAFLSGVGQAGDAEYSAVGHRFAGEIRAGDRTLVVARTFDQDQANEYARELSRAGAEWVDILSDGTVV